MADPVAYLLDELARVTRENRLLRNKLRLVRQSRDRWRTEARVWKWRRH